ncbi:hypothetical protein LTS18_000019 [Coniosporium uncinatum]|uniref:Uncharacterized protein n=1 Tax=Coniosporium uncinatum TaxID=93489 RepID=A0ACC3DDP2_9PEZI|nr:hypothetical protein LTS18_000019 [Coniosporium uncinatum]
MTTTRNTARSIRSRNAFCKQSRRGHANEAPEPEPPKPSGSSSYGLIAGIGLAAAGVVTAPNFEDYQQVYNAIAKKLEEHDEYEDGSYGPVICGWAGMLAGRTSGPNGATMRFAPEGDHGANAGLKAPRDFLEPIKEQFPWLTFSDLWILSAVCAIQEVHGPTLPWRPGRSDRDVSFCTPDSRLPDGSTS